MSGFDLKDYVDVAERVRLFHERYPEGSIQSEIVELSDTRVIVRSFAYRTPDDARPSSGMSQLGIPGTTPYTRGSEIENAETSAVGRAIAFLGFATKAGIASAEEVRNKGGGGQAPAPAPTGPVIVSGVVAKGTGNRMDLLLRQTPDGPMIGFKLNEVEGHPKGNKSCGVRAFGPAAEAIQSVADKLPGSRLAVSGPFVEESFEKDDGSKVRYLVLHVDTAEGAGWTYPPIVGEPPATPPDASADAELDALPW